jgi:hypothetical protein
LPLAFCLIYMETLTIVLASLLAIISPINTIADYIIADNIRSQVKGVEELAVRVDNTPNYQAIEGKVNKIRIASRGIKPIENLRIEALEIETDPLNLNLDKLGQGGKDSLRESLRQPLQAGIRVAINANDINQALQSPQIKSQIEKIINSFMPKGNDTPEISLELSNIHLEFLDNNRIKTQIQIQQTRADNPTPESLDLTLEVGINIVAGRSLQLLEPTGTLNGRKLSSRLLKGFIERFSEKLDLQTLEKQGIMVRILQFNLTKSQLNLAAFVRLDKLTQ